jgi:hypothetical protein
MKKKMNLATRSGRSGNEIAIQDNNNSFGKEIQG